MKKYAIVPELSPPKISGRLLQPWIAAGAKHFRSLREVPEDHIVISVHWPPWLSPLKEWADAGRKFIEIEYGYWGELDKKGHVLTKRVTYCNSHNSNMKQVPFSRIQYLNPPPASWQTQRGDYLLVPLPNDEFLFKRKNITLDQWQSEMLDFLKPYWDGPIKWREKRGTKGGLRQKTFRLDLQGCHAVVGERTMACVEAALLGYPAYSIDISAVTPLMGNNFLEIKNPILRDRTSWYEHIAWSQFHIEEFNKGSAVAEMVEQYQIS